VTCIPVGSTRSTLLDRLSIGYLPLCEKTRDCENPQRISELQSGAQVTSS
jgi:hypothetical protein